jgi:hypothetical protein
MSSRLELFEQEFAAATTAAAAAASKLAELEARRRQLIAEAIADQEAKAAAATAEAAAATAAAAALRASLSPAAPAAFLLPPAQLPAPVVANANKKYIKDYSQLPAGTQLIHIVGRVREPVIERCVATFHDSKNIVTSAGVRHKSINSWAMENLTRNLERLGRESPNVNVFDKHARVFFVRDGELVPLHTIASVERT